MINICFHGGMPYHTFLETGFRTRIANLAKATQSNSSISSILYIDPISFITNRTNKYQQQGFSIKKRSIYYDLYTNSINLEVLCPYYVLMPNRWRYPFLRNSQIIANMINKLDTVATATRAIYYFYHPNLAHVARCVNTAVKIFDVSDRFHTCYKQHNLFDESLEQIGKEQNIFVNAVTSTLDDYLKPYGIKPNSYISNGVDNGFFNDPANLIHGVQCDYLFVATMTQKADVNLLSYIAVNMPDKKIGLLGPVRDEGHFIPLRKYANIIFIGQRPIKEAPGFIDKARVCIIPYNKTGQHGDLLKTYEYFTRGKPTVVTDLPIFTKFNDLLYVAKSNKEFVHKCLEAWQENDDKLHERRISIARKNDWSVKFDELLNAVTHK